jgi:H+-translocating NAD(P) transhydrogenase subunit alpha
MVTIGIPKEVHPGEKRVAATPQTVLKLKKLGFDVAIESGAGASINASDAEYKEAGAGVLKDAAALWAASDVVMKVRPPEGNETDLIREEGWLVGFMWPGQNREIVDKLAKKNATVFAMDSVPRITRAQKMDTLSAMANIAGYRAVIEAAQHFPRFFTGQITAAGKIDPAKVLVIGAGVAGLSAIGAAKGLGAIVRAFDPRSATKDQVASMGAEFLELDVKEEGEGKGGYAKQMSDDFLKAEMALFAAQAMQVDIIVTTALIPGKPAPKLITQGMVESMKPGSVIVDLAAEQGGNCVLTEPGQVTRAFRSSATPISHRGWRRCRRSYMEPASRHFLMNCQKRRQRAASLMRLRLDGLSASILITKSSGERSFSTTARCSGRHRLKIYRRHPSREVTLKNRSRSQRPQATERTTERD